MKKLIPITVSEARQLFLKKRIFYGLPCNQDPEKNWLHSFYESKPSKYKFDNWMKIAKVYFCNEKNGMEFNLYISE